MRFQFTCGIAFESVFTIKGTRKCNKLLSFALCGLFIRASLQGGALLSSVVETGIYL